MAEPANETFDAPDPALDALVETCLATEDVHVLPDTNTICYNAAIFPGQFLQLADMAPADRIIITSPGGNVATARMMSRILDERNEPVVIAGQCMSACAMVLIPGADDLIIHHSAHIAVHGITMMDYTTWFGWRTDGATPSTADLMKASLGYDFGYALHKTGKDHMIGHLEGQHVERGYIDDISTRMLDDARAWPCRVPPKDYWGMIDADHLRRYLGDHIRRMEHFNQSWDAPDNTIYKDVTLPIASMTYIFDRDYKAAGCDGTAIAAEDAPDSPDSSLSSHRD